MPYFCRKLGKMSQNLVSVAVVIGALRVKCYTINFYIRNVYQYKFIMKNSLFIVNP